MNRLLQIFLCVTITLGSRCSTACAQTSPEAPEAVQEMEKVFGGIRREWLRSRAERLRLITALDANRDLIKQHNLQTVDETDEQAVNAFNAASDHLNDERSRLQAEWDAFRKDHVGKNLQYSVMLAERSLLLRYAHLSPADQQTGLNAEATMRRQNLEKEIRHLDAFHQGLRDLIARWNAKQNWREDLDDWVRESQDAELEAIASSVSLLLGPAGPFEERLKLHSFGERKIFHDLEDRELEFREAQQLAGKAAASASETGLTAAAESFQRIAESLKTLKASERTAISRLTGVRTVANEANQAAQRLRESLSITDSVIRQRYSQALKNSVDVVLNLCLDSASEDLAFAGRAGLSKSVDLARWTVDYSFQAFRFATAWQHVNAIQDQIESELKARTAIQKQIETIPPRIRDMKSQISRLENAPKDDVQALRKVLAQVIAAGNPPTDPE